MGNRDMLDHALRLFVAGAVFVVGVGSLRLADAERPIAVVRPTMAAHRNLPLALRPAARVSGSALSPSTTPAKADGWCPALRQIERRVLPRPIVEGSNRYGSLPEYYWDENRSLQRRLNSAKAAFQRDPRPAFRAITLVAGAAGVGKTFIKREVFEKEYPGNEKCKFDLGELYQQWADAGVCVDVPDLSSDGLVISRLKSVVDKRQPRLREYLESRDASFYVIDSLDEIHPDDYAWLLEQIEDFVFHGDRQFVHVAVFGRGFAFREFWHQWMGRGEKTDIRLYLLNPPVFRTTGDLMVSSWNYHCWKYGLSWAPASQSSDKIPLDAYARWVQSGFLREGEFASVACEPNDDMRADVQAALADCAGKYPVVCSALYNLAGNSIMREILRKMALQQQAYDERRTADAYLDAWLTRETKAHHRPSVEQPEYLDLYRALLECVAVISLERGEVDEQGYFPVRGGDTVTVPWKGQQRTFPVKRILDRSGLAFMDPRLEDVPKYRFEPFWFHRLLVEIHGERIASPR